MKRFALSLVSLLSLSAPALAGGDIFGPGYERETYYERPPIVASERIIERQYYRAPIVETYAPRVYADIYYDDGYRYPRPRAYVYGRRHYYGGW